MKVLGEINLREMLSTTKYCRICQGRGYVFVIRPDLNAALYREVRPCSCVRRVVRIEED